MEVRKINLLEFIGQVKITFNIPVYQRNYDWKRENCERLFKDIKSIIEDDFEYTHFLGTIVYVKGCLKANFYEYILIDGQQRITSIMLLLLALHNEINDQSLKEDIYYYYIINQRTEEKFRIKLKPIATDMKAYENLLNNNREGTSNIYTNFNYFVDLIKDSGHNAIDIYKALSNVEIVYIQLDNNRKSENPQLIFESLNSTGLNLLPSDLIRNYLLMNHEYETQKLLYEKYWIQIEKFIPNSLISNFIRDYLTMKTGNIPIKDKVYESFKEFCRKYTNFTEEGILEELVSYVEFYSWFINCNCPDELINRYLSQIQKLKSTVVYPVLLFIFEDTYVYNKLDKDSLVKMLQLITSYIFRRTVCEMPVNALNKIFASLVKELEKCKTINFYEHTSKFLLSKTGKGIFPRDEQFKSNFIKKDFYTSKLAKEVLCQIEFYLNKEKINIEEIEIEHIMPQKLSPKWITDLDKKYSEIHSEYLHTIGNLTLIDYNQEIKNKSFVDKKAYYKYSNISITRKITKYENWNEISIKNRAIKLFEICKEIWKLPYEYDKNIDGEIIDFKIDFNIMEDINVTGLKPRQLIICDEIHSISTWKDMLRVLSFEMFKLDSDLFKSLTFNKDFEGKERRIIKYGNDNMISPFEIGDDIYIETNLSAISILNYCKIICDKFEMQEEVFFNLKV